MFEFSTGNYARNKEKYFQKHNIYILKNNTLYPIKKITLFKQYYILKMTRIIAVLLYYSTILI